MIWKKQHVFFLLILPSDFKNYVLWKFHIMGDCCEKTWFCYKRTTIGAGLIAQSKQCICLLKLKQITIPQVKFLWSILQLVSVAEQAGLTLTWSQTQCLCQHACVSTLHAEWYFAVLLSADFYINFFYRISSSLKPYQNVWPDLSPDCLLAKFSVGLPPVVIEQPYIKENRPRVFLQVACVMSVAMTREKYT